MDLQKTQQGDVLFQIAAAFILGSALENTGVARAIGDVLIDIFKEGGKFGALYGLYLTTVFLTALLTNAAAVNLVFPVAISFINSGYVTVKATAIIVMLGASCDFLTSVGYQTNIMVTVPGGYRFTDFTKIGVLLTLLVSLVGTLCTQFFFNGGTENSLPVTPVPA
jgi:di/tricarboxylate transporter